MKIIGKDRIPISSVDGWYAGAPPKGGASHWVTGRSARELAVAWCGSEGPCAPTEIEQLLRSQCNQRRVDSQWWLVFASVDSLLVWLGAAAATVTLAGTRRLRVT
jgi:hypothetical protein